jgi:hypothetical protein
MLPGGQSAALFRDIQKTRETLPFWRASRSGLPAHLAAIMHRVGVDVSRGFGHFLPPSYLPYR